MKISIPQPCHENWEKMSPAEQGAYCAVCEKVVQDFTRRSDEEINNYVLANTDKKICGRFRSDQLSDKPPFSFRLSDIPKYISPLKKFAITAFIIFGTSLFNITTAQGETVDSLKIEMDSNAIKAFDAVAAADTNSIVFTDTATVDSIRYEWDNDSFADHPKLFPDTYVVCVTGVTGVTSFPEITTIVLGGVWAPIKPEEYPIVMGGISSGESPPDENEDSLKIEASREPELPEKKDEEENVPNEKLQPAENAYRAPLLGSDGDIISAFPNPSSGQITLKYIVGSQSNITISVFDIDGDLVKILIDDQSHYPALYSSQFDLSDLANGSYVIALEQAGEVHTFKILIQK